jgi:hypothetical protein
MSRDHDRTTLLRIGVAPVHWQRLDTWLTGIGRQDDFGGEASGRSSRAWIWCNDCTSKSFILGDGFQWRFDGTLTTGMRVQCRQWARVYLDISGLEAQTGRGRRLTDSIVGSCRVNSGG